MTDCCLDLWRARLRALAITCGCAGTSVTSTFTLHRRALTAAGQVAPRTDLGIEVRPTKQEFVIVVSNEPCVFAGTNPKSDRWQVLPEGQWQVETVMLFTAFADIREGDNLILAADGKTYLVEASSYMGPLRRCFLTTAEAQL